MYKKNQILKTTLFPGFFILFLSTPVAADENVTKPVIALHEKLISVMQQADNYERRYEKLEPVILKHFHTPLIARVVLGRHWKTLDDEQRKEFIDLFNRLVISNYADWFDSFNGQSFNVNNTEEIRANRFVIRTTLILPDNEDVSLDYLVQDTADGWKIISIIANGVNDLSLKRAEYTQLIEERGYDSLIEALQEKIDAARAKQN